MRAARPSWKPLATAPRDGTPIEARGWNFGDRTRGRHQVAAMWNGSRWTSPNGEQHFRYLEEWREKRSTA